MSTIVDDFTHAELYAAYLDAELRYKGVTLTKMLNTPLLYKSLCLQASAMRRKNEQQHGKPAPQLQAA